MSIVEVAKAAGVSTATVSRVMNELPGVRSETVALVRAAMEELAYKPRRTGRNALLRAPRRSRMALQMGGSPLAAEVGLRTGNIAVLTVGHGPGWFERPVLAAVLQGIQRGAGELGLRLMLEEMRDPVRPPPLLAERQVDGAIVLLSSGSSGASGEQTFRAIQACVPAVWAMGTSIARDVVDHITPDQNGIGHLAASHLAGSGCRRLAYLTVDPSWPFMRVRGQAFLNWAADAGLGGAAYLLGADARTRMAYAGGGEVVVADELPELVAHVAAAARRPGGKLGLFVGNDYTMSFAHPRLLGAGLRLGEDLEVVSCDAETARLDGLRPRPASIDIGAEEIGFRSVVRLLARIKRPTDRTISIQIAPRL